MLQSLKDRAYGLATPLDVVLIHIFCLLIIVEQQMYTG